MMGAAFLLQAYSEPVQYFNVIIYSTYIMQLCLIVFVPCAIHWLWHVRHRIFI